MSDQRSSIPDEANQDPSQPAAEQNPPAMQAEAQIPQASENSIAIASTTPETPPIQSAPVDISTTKPTSAIAAPDKQSLVAAPLQPAETPKPAEEKRIIKTDTFLMSDVLHKTIGGATVQNLTSQPVVKRQTKQQSEVQTRRFSQAPTVVAPPPPPPPSQPKVVQPAKFQPPAATMQIQHVQAIQAHHVQPAVHVVHPHMMQLQAMQAMQQSQPRMQYVQRIQPGYYQNQQMIYQIQAPKPLPAAPFPELPSKKEILNLIKGVDAEIDALKRELIRLQNIEKRGFITVPKMSTRDPKLQVQDHRGFIIPHLMVRSVESDSRNRAETAQSRWKLHNVKHKVNHIMHLPHMQKPLEVHTTVVEPMYQAVHNWRYVVHEKALMLANEYSERRDIWENYSRALTEQNREERILIAQWPPEFAKCVQKSKEQILSHVGPDTPMYLDVMESRSYLLHDMNGFVSDPVAEHRAFKRRLAWTDLEIKTFLEKYAQHPREFKRIASALPAKCVKDVIEFYNVHRIALNLKDIEVASRKRGRKKMITEGTVRK